MQEVKDVTVLEYIYHGDFADSFCIGHYFALINDDKIDEIKEGFKNPDKEVQKETALKVLCHVHQFDLVELAKMFKEDAMSLSSLDDFNIDAIESTNHISGNYNANINVKEYYGDFVYHTKSLMMSCRVYKVTDEEYRMICCRERFQEIVKFVVTSA